MGQWSVAQPMVEVKIRLLDRPFMETEPEQMTAMFKPASLELS